MSSREKFFVLYIYECSEEPSLKVMESPLLGISEEPSLKVMESPLLGISEEPSLKVMSSVSIAGYNYLYSWI